MYVYGIELKIFRQPQYAVLITKDFRFKHYNAKENDIFLKDGQQIRRH